MFPWNQFESINDYVKQLLNLDPNEIDQFVKKIIEQNVQYTPPSKTNAKAKERNPNNLVKKEQPQNQSHPTKQLETKVFESLEDVFVQIKVKSKNDIQAGKIFYNSNQLFLKDIPNIGEKHKVLLPALVQQRGAKIHYKNGILQIKIPKADDIQFTEIDLNF